MDDDHFIYFFELSKGNQTEKLKCVDLLFTFISSTNERKPFLSSNSILQSLVTTNPSQTVTIKLLETIVDFIRHFKDDYSSIKDQFDFFAFLFQFIDSDLSDVAKETNRLMIQSVQFIQDDQTLEELLYFIRDMYQDDKDIQSIRFISIISTLIPHVSEICCKNVFVNFIETLSHHQHFRVRQSLCHTLPLISKYIGESITEDRIIPIFNTLSKDEFWQIRKSCAEHIHEMSDLVSFTFKKDVLTPIFAHLATDENRWVYTSAYETLGRFIYSFHGHKIPPSLLDFYFGLIDFVEADFIYICAYNFPAVLLSLGKDKWNDIFPLYERLLQDEDLRVRKTLSHSLHDVANILQTDLTEKYLMKPLLTLLNDIEDVKFGVLSKIVDFFKILSPEKRQEHIHILLNIKKEQNWRVRKSLAKQFGTITSLFPYDIVEQYFLPLFLELQSDDVASVRNALIKFIGPMLATVKNVQETNPFIDCLVRLSESNFFTERQQFANLCTSIYQAMDTTIFNERFLPKLLELSADHVPNVRVNVARALINLKELNPSKKEEIEIVLSQMRADKDKDVARITNEDSKI